MANRWGTVKTVADFILGGSKITADGDFSHEIKRHLLLRRKVMTNLDSILKGRDITLPTKVRLVKAMVFSSGHVWMWELDYKESWAQKKWCFWTVLLEKTLESPLECKEIQPVHPKGDQSWVFIGRTVAEADSNTLATSCEELTHWKRLWCWERLRAEEKETTEDEMAGWHHQLDGHEFGWTPGVGDEQGGLACCASWGCKESDMTELNWTDSPLIL